MADLNQAVTLASESQHHRKILSLALTQRGILHRVLSKNPDYALHLAVERELFSFRERPSVDG